MEYRILGKTGLKISSLGLGGIPIQRIDIEKTKELLQAMVNEGLNYIDTARGYTVSEEYLGQALQGIRDKFVLATKSMSRDFLSMKKDIQISLDNLQTDFIELYQLHNPSMQELEQIFADNGAIHALLHAKQEGKIGHIGITAHSLEVFKKALEYPEIETVMFPYNIIENQAEELMQKCKENNIGFICMKPLAGGAIENSDLAIRYVLQNKNVTVVIPGMAEVEELQKNIKSSKNTTNFNENEIEELEKIRQELGENFCRRCNYCAPCIENINIPAVFLFQGYLNRYSLQQWAKERYNTLQAKASACIECGACESRCPYHLPIRKMLKQAVQDFGE